MNGFVVTAIMGLSLPESLGNMNLAKRRHLVNDYFGLILPLADSTHYTAALGVPKSDGVHDADIISDMTTGDNVDRAA